MSNNFRLIRGNDEINSGLLASMHTLRHEVFHNELKWSYGLRLFANMEFDEYDRPDTYYIVRTNDEGVVDATCRLIPTTTRYMIADHYPDSVAKIPLPQSEKIWEMSRFCASIDARVNSKGKITAQLIAAAIEFGLIHNIENYIALATDHVLPIIRRFGGWDPTPVGDLKKTPDDHAYSVIYTVSEPMLDRVRQKCGITHPLLPDYVPAITTATSYAA